MRPSLRAFALTTHITLSVGWIGAVLAYESAPRRERAARTPVWVWVVGGHAFGLAALFVIFHIATGGLHHH